MNIESQEKKILNYLLKGNKLTPAQCYGYGWGMRLGARIYDIQSRGVKVERKMIKVKSGARVAQYWIEL